MDYIYGELEKSVQKINYKGVTSDTADVIVDNINNTIKVDINRSSLLPSVPKDDGTYILQVVIKDGLSTYYWVSLE